MLFRRSLSLVGSCLLPYIMILGIDCRCRCRCLLSVRVSAGIVLGVGLVGVGLVGVGVVPVFEVFRISTAILLCW